MTLTTDSIVPGAVFIFKNMHGDTVIDLIIHVPKRHVGRCIIHSISTSPTRRFIKDSPGYVRSLTVTQVMMIYDSYNVVRL